MAPKPTIVYLVYTMNGWPELQKPYASKDMNVFYNDSKIDLKLQCDCYTKFQLFKGAQYIFSRLTSVCCMLLPHNPYRLPQHYKRHICGPSCSCKHRFLWISLNLSIRFVLYGNSTPLTTFLIKTGCSLHRPVLIFQPTVKSRASDKQT